MDCGWDGPSQIICNSTRVKVWVVHGIDCAWSWVVHGVDQECK
jgi:hypothetical protein